MISSDICYILEFLIVIFIKIRGKCLNLLMPAQKDRVYVKTAQNYAFFPTWQSSIPPQQPEAKEGNVKKTQKTGCKSKIIPYFCPYSSNDIVL